MTRNDKITRQEILSILNTSSTLIKENKFKFLLGRPKNQSFMLDYSLNLNDAVKIVANLKVEDFCKKDFNNNPQFPEDEYVYIFSTKITHKKLTTTVPVYIKFTIRDSVVVISFHELEYPIKFYFK